MLMEHTKPSSTGLLPKTKLVFLVAPDKKEAFQQLLIEKGLIWLRSDWMNLEEIFRINDIMLVTEGHGAIIEQLGQTNGLIVYFIGPTDRDLTSLKVKHQVYTKRNEWDHFNWFFKKRFGSPFEDSLLPF
jgi:hypothetical protein